MRLNGTYTLAENVVVQIEEGKSNLTNYVTGDILLECNYDELEPKYSNYNLLFNLRKQQPFSQRKDGKLFRDRVFLKDLIVKLKEFNIIPSDIKIDKKLLSDISDQSSIMQNDFAVSLTLSKSKLLDSLKKYVSNMEKELKTSSINSETIINIHYPSFERFKSSIEIEINGNNDFSKSKTRKNFIEAIQEHLIEGTSINLKYGDIETLITVNNDNVFIGNNEDNLEQVFSYEDLVDFYKNVKSDNKLGMK